MGKKKDKKRTASYYIDFENVRGAGLDGVETLHDGDRVAVLYGSKDSALKIEQVQHVLDSPAKVEFIKVATGKHDALDFQLVALLFMDMKKNRDFFIISKDTGFDFAIRMAKARGMERVFRRESISGANLEPKKLPQPRRRKSAKRLPQPKQQPQQSTPQAPTQPEGQAEPASQQVAERQEPEQTAYQPQTAQQTPEQPAPAEQRQEQPAPQPQKRRRRRGGRKSGYRHAVEGVLARHLGESPTARQLDIVLSALEKCETKTQLYNFLRRSLGNEQGRELYARVKGCFEELRAIERPAAMQPRETERTETDATQQNTQQP